MPFTGTLELPRARMLHFLRAFETAVTPSHLDSGSVQAAKAAYGAQILTYEDDLRSLADQLAIASRIYTTHIMFAYLLSDLESIFGTVAPPISKLNFYHHAAYVYCQYYGDDTFRSIID